VWWYGLVGGGEVVGERGIGGQGGGVLRGLLGLSGDHGGEGSSGGWGRMLGCDVLVRL
jgi:hypothetical protein